MGRRKKPTEYVPEFYGPLGTVKQAEWPEFAEAFRTLSLNERERLRENNNPNYWVMYYADLRERALESLWVFVSEVLDNPVLYEPLHKPICDWLQTRNEGKLKKLLLMARGHVKSNIGTVAYSTWRIAKNPNERILVASHKDEDATKFIGAIGNIIQYNEKFRCTFPDIVPAPDKNGQPRRWSQWAILVKRDIDFVEPTVQGTTPRKAASGQHYSLFIPDDIVTHLNVKNETQLQVTEDFKKQCVSLLDPGAEELMIGTRYHFDDEYGRVLETAELRDLYDIKIIPDTNVPGIVDEFIAGRIKWKREHDHQYLNYPSRYTLDKQDYKSPDGEHKNRKSLVDVKLQQGSLTYANQYQLVPRDPATQCFDVNKIDILDNLPIIAPNQRFEWYQFLDHASEKHTQSMTALGTVAIGPRMICYIVDLYWGTFTNEQVCEEMIRWQLMPDIIRPRIVGLGRSAYELQLEQYCRERTKELNISIPFQFVTTVEQLEDKNDHIRRLTPFVERRKIKILKDCANRQQIIHEFDRFPKSKQKDCIDMLANIAKIALPGREREFLEEGEPTQAEAPRAGMTFDDVLRQIERGSKVRIGSHQVRSTGKVRMR